MPLIQLLKEREALSTKGEQYKQAVTRYLQSRGYELDIDSAIEGTFEDQIYFRKDRIRVNVECKDTKVGVFSDDFLIPFGVYLSRFMKLASKDRFVFIYCTREIASREKFEMIFNELNEDSIQELLSRTISKLQSSKRESLNRISEIVSTIEMDTLITFVSTSEIIVASYEELERATEMRISSSTSPFIRSLASIQKITQSFVEQSLPDQIQEKISTNIFPVTKIPERVSYGSTSYPNAKSVIESLTDPFYPFILREKKLITFSDLTEKDNVLRSVITGKPNSKMTLDFFDSRNKQMWLLDLLNQSLKKHALSLGMENRKNKHFFPSLNGRDVVVKWHTGTRLSNPRYLARWYFPKSANRPSFCKHRSLSMGFRIMNGSFFLVLNPDFHFSKNGIDALNPRLTTKLSSGAWAKNHNNRVLYDIRFWANFLAQRHEAISIDTGGEPIEVDTMPEIVNLEVGINDDTLPASSFLAPIQTPIFRVFQKTPTRQVNLEDEYLLIESSSTDEEEIE